MCPLTPGVQLPHFALKHTVAKIQIFILKMLWMIVRLPGCRVAGCRVVGCPGRYDNVNDVACFDYVTLAK